ncbi:GNAT family N-acetyltransferase [Jatrophihabitans sp.]|uniref:GNAT family N-acetyltransferase n=1 Tax=Jatrophihabitans sp. TaxID=1932789 RepID=UPI002B938A22|nr:GNAT family N-acetyltransferase [Jatrophihabitans sp.]
MPELVRPSTALAPSFRAAMADFAAEGRGGPDDDSALGRQLRESAPHWHTDSGLARFLDELHAQGDTSLPPPPNWVHSSTYWWAEGAEFLGAIRIRHRLTPALLEHGGHIGYDIAPKARRRGYGTAMLRAALPVAAGLGIEKALITCDVDNIGSRKVIEANGGVLEDERGGMLRFWVPTS